MTRSEDVRLAVLEATTAEQGKTIIKKLDEMGEDLKAIRKDLDADKAELQALKNKGAGILIGVGLAGGAIGASVVQFVKGLLS